MYAAKVLADSVACGVRLVTMEVTFPRFILAEFNTHRMLSRNSASSRAIPVERRIQQVVESPFIPASFSENQKGMQADNIINGAAYDNAVLAWVQGADAAVRIARKLLAENVHKQHANRVLEPYCWHTVVVSATEWANFFALRCHPAAQPEMQITAKLMRDAFERSTPRQLAEGEWHLPYVDAEELAGITEFDIFQGQIVPLLHKSVARCAAVSFERQDVRKTAEQYAERHDSLKTSAHWSPFEHQAQNREGDSWPPQFYGNFRFPWRQYRKTFEGEAVFRG